MRTMVLILYAGMPSLNTDLINVKWDIICLYRFFGKRYVVSSMGSLEMLKIAWRLIWKNSPILGDGFVDIRDFKVFVSVT